MNAVVASLVAGAGWVGCSAPEGNGTPDSDTADIGTVDAGDGDIGGVDVGDSGSGGTGTGTGKNIGPDGLPYCSAGAIKFVPRTPTVFVLVDRSGSIFDQQQWIPLRDAVLPVIQELQGEVRFGLGAYNSINNACSDVVDDQGTIGLDNYESLATFYNAFTTTKPSGAVDTPTSIAIQQTSAILQADDGPGAKAILLVTAGKDADFCDNGSADCGNDAVIGATQAAFAGGVQTFVFGLAGADDKDWLDFWAQGGNGELPNWTTGLTKDEYSGMVASSCGSNAGWKAAWTAAGRTGYDPIGMYSAEGGSSEAFLSNDTTTIASEIRKRAQGLKSCVQDLSSPDFAGVKEGAAGNIFIGGALPAIPATDWRMNSPTVLELLGDSCKKWLQEDKADLFAGFTCDELVVK